MISATHRANDLLAFLVKYKADHGTSPSFDEMKEALGLRSKSGIHRIVEQLVERGRIRRLPGRARAIEIIPDDYFAVRVDPALWEPLFAAARDCGMSVDRFVNDQIAVMVSA